MLIQLSYWDIEEAVIEYLQEKYRCKFENEVPYDSESTS